MSHPQTNPATPPRSHAPPLVFFARLLGRPATSISRRNNNLRPQTDIGLPQRVCQKRLLSRVEDVHICHGTLFQAPGRTDSARDSSDRSQDPASAAGHQSAVVRQGGHACGRMCVFGAKKTQDLFLGVTSVGHWKHTFASLGKTYVILKGAFLSTLVLCGAFAICFRRPFWRSTRPWRDRKNIFRKR